MNDVSADNKLPLIRVLCGPTAAGKSSIAMTLAERHGASIICADSRQIYRRFDIGTAKPTSDELYRVSHYCVDLISPEERYSAALWAEEAERAILRLLQSGGTPLVVGGTGFYLRALFEPLVAEPEMDPGARRALESELDSLPTGELRRWCESLDPRRATLGRTQLIRAVLVALLSGKRISELHDVAARAPRFRAHYAYVDPGLQLQERISRRFQAMMEAGWSDEVRELAETVPESAPAWNATGYLALRDMIRGLRSAEATKELVVIRTRQYAKRQRTWFRNQLALSEVSKFSPDAANLDRQLSDWWHFHGIQ